MTGATFNALTGQVDFSSPGKPSAAVAGLRLAESDEFSYRLPAPLRELVNKRLDDEGVLTSRQVAANRMS